MATITRPANEDDLRARSSAGVRCELVDGEIRPLSPAGGRHGQICVKLSALLLHFVRADRLGEVLDSSTGFRLPSGNVRAPDVAFVAGSRFEAGVVPTGFVPLSPDLAIEVQSPDDRPRDVLDKVGELLEAGTRMVWVVDPAARAVTVYLSPTDVRSFGEDDVIDGGAVLPGFRCRPSDFL